DGVRLSNRAFVLRHNTAPRARVGVRLLLHWKGYGSGCLPLVPRSLRGFLFQQPLPLLNQPQLEAFPDHTNFIFARMDGQSLAAIRIVRTYSPSSENISWRLMKCGQVLPGVPKNKSLWPCLTISTSKGYFPPSSIVLLSASAFSPGANVKGIS